MAPNVVVADTSEALDSSNPFFLHASNLPWMTLPAPPSTKKEMEVGRVLIALSAKNKQGFIDGTCQAPAVDSANHKI